LRGLCVLCDLCGFVVDFVLSISSQTNVIPPQSHNSSIGSERFYEISSGSLSSVKRAASAEVLNSQQLLKYSGESAVMPRTSPGAEVVSMEQVPEGHGHVRAVKPVCLVILSIPIAEGYVLQLLTKILSRSWKWHVDDLSRAVHLRKIAVGLLMPFCLLQSTHVLSLSRRRQNQAGCCQKGNPFESIKPSAQEMRYQSQINHGASAR
jgi:hypothetical protein